MDKYDMLNLLFLLEAGEEVIKDWYSKIDEDDRRYALTLLFCYRLELSDDVEDLTEANQVLSKFYRG